MKPKEDINPAPKEKLTSQSMSKSQNASQNNIKTISDEVVIITSTICLIFLIILIPFAYCGTFTHNQFTTGYIRDKYLSVPDAKCVLMISYHVGEVEYPAVLRGDAVLCATEEIMKRPVTIRYNKMWPASYFEEEGSYIAWNAGMIFWMFIVTICTVVLFVGAEIAMQLFGEPCHCPHGLIWGCFIAIFTILMRFIYSKFE